MSDQEKIERLRAALLTLLDQVDYKAGNCSPTDMVAAVLPKEVLNVAYEALENTR